MCSPMPVHARAYSCMEVVHVLAHAWGVHACACVGVCTRICAWQQCVCSSMPVHVHTCACMGVGTCMCTAAVHLLTHA